MKNSFIKLQLIATFSIFTITSTCFNYCFGNSNTDYGYVKPEVCENCGCHNFKFESERWFDEVYFDIHTYTCTTCGFWYVYYVYPIPEESNNQ